MSREKTICIGRVCRAKAGRGKGRYFLICGIVDVDYVLLTDGDTRKADKPKRKKVRHLECRPYVAEELAEKIRAGCPLVDAEVRNTLARVKAAEESKEK